MTNSYWVIIVFFEEVNILLVSTMRDRFLFCMILCSICSCAEKSRETNFVEKINTAIGANDKVIISLEEIESSNWDQVCFGYGPGATFIFRDGNNKSDIKMAYDSDIMYINEGYVEGSPSEKCYDRGEKFVFEKEIILEREKILLKTSGKY